MPALTTHRPLPVLTPADLRYIRASFTRLDDLSAAPAHLAALITEGRLPRPAYVLADGTAMVGHDYLALLDAAGTIDALPATFASRYRAAAGTVADVAVDDAWEGYLTGEYGVCLREVTPETIFRKDQLVATLTAQLASPAPEDPSWRRALLERVIALDRLTRPFAPCDRIRFGGPVSRDRLIDEPRRSYPRVFAEAALGSATS